MHGKHYTIYYKRCFYLLICNEFSCIDKGNQLLIITNTINSITTLHPSNLTVYLHDYFLQCNHALNQEILGLIPGKLVNFFVKSLTHY